MSSSPHDIIVLKTTSACSLVVGEITMYNSAWNSHIKPDHPEIVSQLKSEETALELIRMTLHTPNQVAESKPGPGNRNLGNYVFIKEYPEYSRKALHVMVRSSDWTVRTALLPRTNHHGRVVWVSGAQRPEVGAEYDVVADVLYVFKDQPVPALTDEDEDGLLLRYAIDDDRPVGITVPSYHEVWEAHRDNLIERISAFLNVTPAVARYALEHTN